MPEDATTTPPFTTLGTATTEGYCDPVTGACVWTAPVGDDETPPGTPEAPRQS